MNNDTIQQEIREKVLGRIRGGEVHMRTRAYFLVRVVAAAGAAVLALLISAFLLSFIAFSIHASGQQFLLGFGGPGVSAFLALFPWPLLIADIALLFLLEWLLQGFKLGYRVSLLVIFLGVFAASSVLALAVNLTPLHGALLEQADRGALPLGGELYENIRESHRELGIFRGTVMSAQGGQIVLGHDDRDHDRDDGTWQVQLPPGAPPPRVGDRVYIFGTSTGPVVHASDIEQLSPDQ